MAVLAGDALLTLAFETIARTPADAVHTMPSLIRELARAAGAVGVIGGQVEDTLSEGKATPELIHYVFEHKTADLFKAAMRLGAVSVNAPSAISAKISAYAAHLGFAFQIIDDILDQDQSAADAKPELSCLAIMSADDARIWASEHTREAVAALESLPGDTAALEALAETMLRRVV
jgi:geranylgeranyl diphosphate synthase, type II